MEILGFIILSVIAYIMDITTNKCKKLMDALMFYLLFLHHLLTVIIYYGWLSNNKTFLWMYLFVPMIFLLYWKLNNDKCDVSVQFNENCGINKNEFFHDFLYFLGIKHLVRSKLIKALYVFFCMSITLFKLHKFSYKI